MWGRGAGAGAGLLLSNLEDVVLEDVLVVVGDGLSGVERRLQHLPSGTVNMTVDHSTVFHALEWRSAQP